MGIDDSWFQSGVRTELYTLATVSIPTWCYFACFESSGWRGTPGKRLMRLQVVPVNPVAQFGLSRYVLRAVLKLLPWELAHLANNLPVPIWYDPNPGFRWVFLASGALMLFYVAAILRSARGVAPYDALLGLCVERTPR
jgi:hypothetical protein